MQKPCVVLNGQIINIGPWDDQNGENPLPEGAEIVEMEVEQDEMGGWYVVGHEPPEAPQQKIARLEAELAAAREENLTIMEAVAEIYEMIASQGGGGT